MFCASGKKEFKTERWGNGKPQTCLPAIDEKGTARDDKATFKQEQPLEERLAEEAKRLRAKAITLAKGARREELLRREKEVEAGVQMTKWLRPAAASKETA